MQELLVVEVIPREKGRTSIRFDNLIIFAVISGPTNRFTFSFQVSSVSIVCNVCSEIPFSLYLSKNISLFA